MILNIFTKSIKQARSEFQYEISRKPPILDLSFISFHLEFTTHIKTTTIVFNFYEKHTAKGRIKVTAY